MSKRMIKQFYGWMTERHRIWRKRKAGERAPWTKDKILREYKFTNVFRELDRVTLELKRLVKDVAGKDEALLLFQIVLFRMFNLPETYEALSEAGLHKKWQAAKAKRILHTRAARKEQVFTGAYIITNNGLPDSKIDLVCDAITRAWKKKAVYLRQIKEANTMEGAVKVLQDIPMVGGFIAYEFACDLRYTDILRHATDVRTWANPGPGARRGLNRVYGRDLKKRVPLDQCMEEMRELLALQPKYGMELPGLEMREIEHSLCEFDKYMRVKNGEGRPRSKFNEAKHR